MANPTSMQHAAGMQMRPLRPTYGGRGRGSRGGSSSGSSGNSGSRGGSRNGGSSLIGSGSFSGGSLSYYSPYTRSSSLPRSVLDAATKNIAIIRRDDPILGPYRPRGSQKPEGQQQPPGHPPSSSPFSPPPPQGMPYMSPATPYSPYPGLPPQMPYPMIPTMPPPQPYPSPLTSQVRTTLMPLAQPPTAATPIVIPAAVFASLSGKVPAFPPNAKAVVTPASGERKVIELPGSNAPTLVQPEPDASLVHKDIGHRTAHQVYMSSQHPFDPDSTAPLMPASVPQHVREQINAILKQGLEPDGTFGAKAAHIGFVTPPSSDDKEAIPEYCINFYK